MMLLVIKRISLHASQIADDRSFAVHADNIDEALSILRHGTFDAVVVDVTSFSEEGFVFIRRLRAARNDTPVVALTGRGADHRVRALGLGADDAVAEPVDLGELRARIAAVVRRHKGHGQSLIQVGDLALSLDTREVSFRKLPVHLTSKEYSILELLVLRKGLVVTKEMFLTHLYNGMNDPGTKIIDVFVCKLRRRLNRVGGNGVIETVYGHGYTIRTIGKEVSAPQAGVSAEMLRRPVSLAKRIDDHFDYGM